MPMSKLVYLTTAAHDMEEVVKFHIANVGPASARKVYVSMENRMACGMGACLVCTCKTKSGNKRACKDGPVMEGWEVFG